MDSGLEDISDYELHNMAIDARLTDLHTAMPAKVTAFYADKQTVDVIPMLNRSLPDGAGDFVSEALPPLADVQVVFPRAGGFFVSFPIAVGDFVLLVFSERNTGAWRSTGQQGDPGDQIRHSLDGAMAIAGVFPDAKALQNVSATDMLLGSDATAAARIRITGSEIQLGDGATHFVALANLVNSAVASIKTTFNAHIHAVTAAPGNTAVPTTLIGSLPDVSSTNTKAGG